MQIYIQSRKYSDKLIMEEFWHDQQLIFGTPEFPPMAEPKFEFSGCKEEQYDQKNHKPIPSLKSIQIGTKESSLNDKKRMAGQKSREKKKTYVKDLEEKTKKLALQIQKHDKEISNCKDRLVEALRTNHSHVNQHTYTLSQLQANIQAEDPNLDKINLLIDIVSNRVGANSKERQANLDYTFKQAINSIFPALYRYILNSAGEQTEIFIPNATAQLLVSKCQNWTQELFSLLQLEDWQISEFNKMRNYFCQKRMETIGHIKRLNACKQAIKTQGEVFSFQQKLGSIRTQLTPIQCAFMAIFAQNNKLRRQFTFYKDYEDYDKMHKMIKKE